METFTDDVIRAKDIRLRPMRESDLPWIVTACNDPVTQRWLPLPRPYSLDDARFFAFELAPHALGSGQGIERAIEVDGQFVGVIGLKSTDRRLRITEAGYWLGPWARGRGIMPRALSALTDWALDRQHMVRVEVRVAPDNLASQATARRSGFIHEGRLRRAGIVHDGRTDLELFSRLVDDPRPSE